jgi:hypothetical protein
LSLTNVRQPHFSFAAAATTCSLIFLRFDDVVLWGLKCSQEEKSEEECLNLGWYGINGSITCIYSGIKSKKPPQQKYVKFFVGSFYRR